jgi:trimethylamine--corrinoid protein Co-methyltransferase
MVSDARDKTTERGRSRSSRPVRARSRGGPRKTGQFNQLPWRNVVRPYKPMEIFSEDQIEAIHDNSMRILEELGIEFMDPVTLDMLRQAGADVDDSTGLVKFDRAMVMEYVAKAPRTFTLTSRNPERRLTIGDNSVVFSLMAGAASVHDTERGRRPANFKDFENILRIAQQLNCIHYVGNQVIAPIDLPAEDRHLDCYFANLTLTDRSYQTTAIGANRAMDGVNMMAISRGMTVDEMRHDPGVTTVISINSPRRFDGPMAEGLVAMAQAGQPSIITPFTLMGAMTPVSIPAALSQQNAEALSGIMLSQIAAPGSPVAYGCYVSDVDMKSGAPAFGTPEYMVAAIGGGQLARRYNLPYRSSNACSANTVDAQAAYESLNSLWGAVLGGANIVYQGAGWMEGGLLFSYEKLLLDAELIQQVMEFLKPVKFDEDELGFEAIKGVKPGGHFFGEPHTMARYETAFYAPFLSDWRNYENWEIAGGLTATQRATTLWKQLLDEYEEPTMPQDRREELEAYVARRKGEIAKVGI